MKKSLILVGMLAIGYANAQYDGKVGINTDQPKATLDLNVANVNKDKTTNEGILAPRLSKTRVANIAVPQEGTLVYVTNEADSPISAYTGTDTKVEKITEKGYYYYNGEQWVSNGGKNENIYNTNGTLSGDRTINGNGKDLMIRNLKDFAIQSDKGTIYTNVDSETERPTITVEGGDLKVNNFLKVTRNATVEGSVQAHLLRASNLAGVHDRPVVATPNGILKIADGPTGTGINIYNDDGTLLGNRVVNNNGKTLTFTNNSSFKINTTSTNDKYFEVQDVQIATNLPYESNSIVSAKNLRATSLAGTGNRLVIADANGTLKLGTATSVTGDNIYNTNGTLSGNRTINGNNKSLIINNLKSFYISSEDVDIYDGIDNGFKYLRTLFIDVRQLKAKTLLTGGAVRAINLASTTTTDDRPVVADKDGILKIGTYTDTSIYNNDGTLSAKRTVNTNGNDLSFTGTGKIGIGVETPTQKLDVDGSIKSSSLQGTGDRNVVASADGTLKIGNPVPNVRFIRSNSTSETDLRLSDNGGFVYVYTSDAVQIGVPTSLPVGFSCVIVREGSGEVTIKSGNGYTTLETARGNKLRTQHSAVGIIKHRSTYFTLTGDAIE